MKTKQKILIGGIVVAAAVAAALGLKIQERAKRAKTMSENMSRVETVQVKKQNLVDAISVTGTIQSADARDVSASAKDVKVLQVNCEAGDYVQAGDVIAVLDTTDLELSLTQARNSQSLSGYKENKSIQTATEKYTEAVEDGTDEYIKALKAAADAKEDLQEAEAEASGAANELKRQEEQVKKAKESEDQQAVNAAQAEYTSRHQAYQAAAEAEEKAQEAYEKAVEALEEAEKNNTRNVSEAADSLEQAQMEHTYSNDSSSQTIENLQEQIDSCTVTSPISGVITAVNVAEGDTYSGEGKALFSVADQEHFVVAANVDEYDINSIQKDMTAAVIVEAAGEEELPAKVSFVSPTVTESNMGNSTYQIEIALDDENTDLRIGMTARASIVLKAVYDVLTVPYDCVEKEDDSTGTVYIDKGGEKTPVTVALGMESDYYVEISADGVDEDTMVYYSEPMAGQTSEQDSQGEDAAPGMMFEMGTPGGGSGGGGPSGTGRGGPRGF
ncbi:MAG TPA: hypothetical protein DD414_01075 [Lachnospiraceae bacterium]|nr:hypothetical protein [Lachnospiraceae bacterium]